MLRTTAVAAGLLLLAACGDGAAPAETEFRSLDGAGNNPHDPQMGQAGTPLARAADAAFADGMAAPPGHGRKSAREISNLVCAQQQDRPNAAGASSFLWQWGQFLDHDITLSPEQQPDEPMPIPVPPGDPQFDPGQSGAEELPFHRSAFDPASGVAGNRPREQMNALTAYIDASNVYGSDVLRAGALRTLDGTGRLRVSDGKLLPFNTDGLPNAMSADDPELFLAGDIRANEQVGLLAMHTLFVREHNRLADAIAAAEPELSGEAVFQRARALVGARMQAISYREFLPLLLGENALPPYAGYDPAVDARIMNEFSTAAFRLGHSLLTPELWRLDADGEPIAAGHLPLRAAFFAPERLVEDGGIEPLLRGLAAQPSQEVDPHIVDDVRNFLFGPPGDGGLDLCALNLQRGRDHGLPGYNRLRAAYGLSPHLTIATVTSDAELRARLAEAYDNVEQIDAWVGIMAEDHRPGAMVGELAFRILVDQFTRLRDGDRYWYENPELGLFSADELEDIRTTTLADVIRANSDIGAELPDDVFRVAGAAP